MGFLSTRRRLLQPGVQAFSPHMLGGLACWFDAFNSQPGQVQLWEDKSGSGVSLAGSASVSSINGSGFITPATAMSSQDIPSLSLRSEITVFAVCMTPAGQNSNIFSVTHQYSYEIFSNKLYLRYATCPAIGVDLSGGSSLSLTSFEASSTPQFSSSGQVTDAVAVRSPFILSASSKFFGGIGTASRDMIFRINGVVRRTEQKTSGRFGPPSEFPLSDVRLNVGGLAVGEMLVYCRSLDMGEQDEVIGMLSEKWGIQTSSRAYELVSSPSFRKISQVSGVERTTLADRVVELTSPATEVTDYRVFAKPRLSNIPFSVSLSSSDTSKLLNPDASGLSQYVSDGQATISASMPDGSVESVALRTFTRAVNQGEVFVAFAEGSAAKAACDAIDARIAGKSASTAKAIFSTLDHSSPSYSRSLSCWASGIDLTCCSAWNSSGIGTMGGVLVSPRHMIVAAHYQIPAGATVRFVSGSGTIVTRTVSSSTRHPLYKPHYPDLAVCTLDSDVPQGISFAKVLPDSWLQKMPSISAESPIPAMVVDSEKKALTADIFSIGGTVILRTPSAAQRLDFFENMVTGDSGSPVFVVFGSQPVLLSVVTYGGAGEGTFITQHRAAINALMDPGGYQLADVDLSGFPNYG